MALGGGVTIDMTMYLNVKFPALFKFGQKKGFNLKI